MKNLPNVTVGAESSLLNFIILAESVTLAPTTVFCDSPDVFVVHTEGFDLLSSLFEAVKLDVGCCSCPRKQYVAKLSSTMP